MSIFTGSGLPPRKKRKHGSGDSGNGGDGDEQNGKEGHCRFCNTNYDKPGQVFFSVWKNDKIKQKWGVHYSCPWLKDLSYLRKKLIFEKGSVDKGFNGEEYIIFKPLVFFEDWGKEGNEIRGFWKTWGILAKHSGVYHNSIRDVLLDGTDNYGHDTEPTTEPTRRLNWRFFFGTFPSAVVNEKGLYYNDKNMIIAAMNGIADKDIYDTYMKPLLYNITIDLRKDGDFMLNFLSEMKENTRVKKHGRPFRRIILYYFFWNLVDELKDNVIFLSHVIYRMDGDNPGKDTIDTINSYMSPKLREKGGEAYLMHTYKMQLAVVNKTGYWGWLSEDMMRRTLDFHIGSPEI